MPITALFAALLAPLFLFLSWRVITLRGSTRTALGDGGNPELFRRMRVQANFAEYAPLALVLIGLSESLRAPAPLVALLGAVLLAGRLLHAFGVSQAKENFRIRVWGMYLTVGAIGCAALLCLVMSVMRLI